MLTEPHCFDPIPAVASAIRLQQPAHQELAAVTVDAPCDALGNPIERTAQGIDRQYAEFRNANRLETQALRCLARQFD